MIRRRALIVTISLALIASLSVVPLAFGATEAELRDHEQAAADAREAAAAEDAKANQLAAEVRSFDDRIDAIEADISALADDIEAATTRADRLKAEVDQLRSEISAKEAEIAKTQAEYERQQSLLAGRLQESYKQGDLFYLEMLFSSKNIEDLIARTTLVQRVIRQNEEIVGDLKTTQQSLERAKTELDRIFETVNTKRLEAEAEEKRLTTLRSQHASKLAEQKNVQDSKAALMAESKENAARLRKLAEFEEAESAKIAKELYGTGSGYYAGIMAWPVPGFYRVSSPFGYRIHPILGIRKLHTGIDIGRNLDPPKSIDGAAIVATEDGKVIYASYRSGYGNTVMIDHGNGIVTLYAHQQNGGIKVSVGQNVTKGQRVGTVGSTGLSTGPHLHFEVRVNGTCVDPMKYLK
ncbi:MAG: peptidoglycan DD-metalloendopeptidase family protein [Coriobacteriia bacterium]|nr:peptidoglycan DD-metalloendopeptidase family protein [Coriobacteriia bacterium]